MSGSPAGNGASGASGTGPASSSGMPARYSFSFLGQDGKPVMSGTGIRPTRRPFKKSSYGYGDFMKHEEFDKSECLKDDSFTLRCDVFVAARESTNDQEAKSLDDTTPVDVGQPKSDLQNDLAELLWSKQGTDVTIEAGGETFHAHRWLLAARSPEFKEKLFGSTQKKTATHIQVEDMEPQVFKSLLNFMYTDTLPEIDEEALTKMTSGLLAAADRYKLEKLKTTCEEMLCKRVDMSMLEASLALSEKYHCLALRAECMEFLNSPGVLKAIMAKDDGFEMLNKSCPTVVMELVMKKMAS